MSRTRVQNGASFRFPKPSPQKVVKARTKRAEGSIIQTVRRQVLERDRGCRVPLSIQHECQGALTYHHLVRRSKTRGRAAKERHTRAHGLTLCAFHHHQADQGSPRLQIVAAAPGPLGADGSLVFSRIGDMVLGTLGVTSPPRGTA